MEIHNRSDRMRNLLIHFIVFLLVPSVAVPDKNYDVSTGYRINDYRYPIDRELAVGKTISSESELSALSTAGALLIDVAPIAEYLWIEDLGTWQLPVQHLSLADAVWLPNVGKGVLDNKTLRYLKTALKKRATKSRSIVVFCFEDCWMSWNATQRIFRLGYKNVFWYPKGVTGRSPDQLQPVEPEPFLD